MTPVLRAGTVPAMTRYRLKADEARAVARGIDATKDDAAAAIDQLVNLGIERIVTLVQGPAQEEAKREWINHVLNRLHAGMYG